MNNKSQIKLLFIGILKTMASVACAIVLGIFTNRVSAINLDNKLSVFIIMIIGTYIIKIIFLYFYRQEQQRYQTKLEKELQILYINAVNGATMEWLNEQKAGNLLDKFQSDIENTSRFYAAVIPNIVLQTTELLIFSAIMLRLNWQLTGFYLFLSFIIIVSQFFLSKPIQKSTLNSREESGKSNTMAQDILMQRKTIKVFNLQNKIRKWYQVQLQREANAVIQKESVYSPLRTAGWVFGIFPVLLLCIMGMVFLTKGMLSFTSFMIIFFLADQSLANMLHYAENFSEYRSTKVSANRIQIVLEVPQEEATWKQEQKEILPVTEHTEKDNLLCFRGIYYSYEKKLQKGQWAVENVSFTLKKGEKIAVVGKSGCGKSTLLKLVAGFLKADKGCIYMENQNYEELELMEVRKKISLVPQDSFLFSDTIKNNILCGTEETISEEIMNSICKEMQIYSFTKNFPKGLETPVEEKGKNLSGGQMQRIAIARAFVKKASIILFDEATSALDAENENLLQKEIEKNAAECAMIFVAHRLSTIRDVDKIYVMENGRIVEEGRHDELLRKGGEYASLYRMQEEGK